MTQAMANDSQEFDPNLLDEPFPWEGKVKDTDKDALPDVGVAILPRAKRPRVELDPIIPMKIQGVMNHTCNLNEDIDFSSVKDKFIKPNYPNEFENYSKI